MKYRKSLSDQYLTPKGKTLAKDALFLGPAFGLSATAFCMISWLLDGAEEIESSEDESQER